MAVILGESREQDYLFKGLQTIHLRENINMVYYYRMTFRSISEQARN